jgi:hypothetical protein
MFEEDEDWADEVTEEGSCNYGVSEICSDPQTKDLGLCTTECQAYLELVKKEQETKGQ